MRDRITPYLPYIKQEEETLKPSSDIKPDQKSISSSSYLKLLENPQISEEISIPKILKYSQKIIETQNVPLNFLAQDYKKTEETSFELFSDPEALITHKSQEKVQNFLKKSFLKSQDERILESSQYIVIEGPAVGDWKCPIF